jgi:hypothetical protein
MPWFHNYYTSRFFICIDRRIVHKSGLSIDATVSKVIQSGEWICPSARTAEIVEVQSATCVLFSLKLNRKVKLLGGPLLKAFSHQEVLGIVSGFKKQELIGTSSYKGLGMYQDLVS